MKKNILITGCAGFIGFHLANKFLENKNVKIYGIDNLNDYYDVDLKRKRIKILKTNSSFNFKKIDLRNFENLQKYFHNKKFYAVYHLAAQAGVRYSILNPKVYLENNISAFYNVMYLSNKQKVKHFLFASTSSVYGSKTQFPLKEKMNTDKPLSFYAATKKCNEVMAYSFSHIFKLKTTGLRFFTVYGPLGRPDMALYKFAKAISKNKKLELYNKGNHVRDFTFIDDVVFYLIKLLNKKPNNNENFQILNISNSLPKNLKIYLKIIEKNLNKKSKKKLLPLQKGDVLKTHGDNSVLVKKVGKLNPTSLEKGIKNYIHWFKDFYGY